MKVTVLGNGNMATQLAHAFFQQGIKIHQVYVRTLQKGQEITQHTGGQVITRISDLDLNADLYLICVSDDVIVELVDKIPPHITGTIVHTAGSVSMDVLTKFQQYGVFYPLQTLQKSRLISFQDIPVLIEGNNEKSIAFLQESAEKISKKVQYVNSEKRMMIHLAAVFASNFTNFMYMISEDLLQKQNLSFELLHPLILETAQKAIRQSPKNSQTGPAKRGDQETIQKHLDLLKEQKTHQDLYRYLSRLIGE